MKAQMGVELDLNPLLTLSVHGGECNARPGTGICTAAFTLEISAFLNTRYFCTVHIMTLTVNSAHISEQQ